MQKKMIAGLGEILWDVIGNVEKLGGAPVNFAFHANELGAQGLAVSTVGDDERGRLVLEILRENGLQTGGVSVLHGAVTGFVEAHVDEDGVANYNFPDDVAWDNIKIAEETRMRAPQLDCICFGSLAQRSLRSRTEILDFLRLTGKNTLKIFDLNIRQNFYSKEVIDTSLQLADVLKLNDDELILLSEMYGLTGDETGMLNSMQQNHSLSLVALTRGAKGSILLSGTEKSEYAGQPIEVVDTIGAGDSFTAAVAIGMLAGRPLERINLHANRVAAYVCGKKGAMVQLPEELKNG